MRDGMIHQTWFR